MNEQADDWLRRWIEAQQTGLNEWLNPLAVPAQGTAWPDVLSTLASGFPALDQTLLGSWQRAFAPRETASNGAIPAVGPLREHQELLEELNAAVLEHQQLLAQFTAIIAQVHRDTLDLLARRMQEQVDAGTPPKDGTALHALWVECGEQVYSEVARTVDYCRLQAQLANTAVRVRTAQQQLVERFLKQWDLPTRAELNTVHQQLRALRKQLAEFTTKNGQRNRPAKPRSATRTGKSSRKPRRAQ